MEFKEIWPNLPNEMSWQLASQAKDLIFKRGDKIYQQGNSPLGIYVVKKGLVGLTALASTSGKEHLLRFFKEGQFFGHRSLFSNEDHHATAIALEITNVKLIPKELMLNVLEKNPILYKEIVIVLAMELRRCEQQRVMILENQILARTAQSLIYLKDLHPEHNWTRQEIANFCASTVSTIIKALAYLEEKGLISQNGRSIDIINRPGLIVLQDSES
jgi:CRP-like cAMP-binding protein